MLNFIKNFFKGKKKVSVTEPNFSVAEPKEPYCPYTSIKYQIVGKKSKDDTGIRLEIGMRVIARSNEPDPLIIGTIESFYCPEHWTRFDESNSSAIPQIKDEKTGEMWGCLGIVRPYSDDLMKELEPLRDIEQWNYLAGEYYQIEEKYGVHYKTFR